MNPFGLRAQTKGGSAPMTREVATRRRVGKSFRSMPHAFPPQRLRGLRAAASGRRPHFLFGPFTLQNRPPAAENKRIAPFRGSSFILNRTLALCLPRSARTSSCIHASGQPNGSFESAFPAQPVSNRFLADSGNSAMEHSARAGRGYRNRHRNRNPHRHRFQHWLQHPS